MTDKLISPGGLYELNIQNDGNLVTYRRADGTPIWASGGDPNPLPPPPTPPPSTLPRLRVNGHVFETVTGEPFTAIQESDFNLLNRWQHGEDITPILAQRVGCGFNLLRVWTLYDLAAANIGTFLDIDYARVPAFLRLCASFRLYVEFTAYTSLERRDHWDQLVAAVQGEPVLLELVNEGDLAVNKIVMTRYGRPAGVLASHGSGSSEAEPMMPSWDYCGWHSNGASEEQRKPHNAMSDVADLYHVPTLVGETSRFNDVGMWRGADATRVRNLAFDTAACAALLAAGSCMHSIQGKQSVLWDDATIAMALAWTAGARSVPLKFQKGQYLHRSDLEGPDDLRVYERRLSDGLGWIVHVRK